MRTLANLTKSRLQGRDYVNRLVACAVRASLDKHKGLERIADELFPDDEATLQLTRAAVSPATTTTTGWAAEVAATAVGDFLVSLGPESGAAQLIARSTMVPLAGRKEVAMPRRLGLPATVPFITEGGPLPVVQRDLSTILLSPKKMGIISAYTEEAAASSAIEQIVSMILREDAAASLDAAMFSDAAATTARPAGLLNGVTPIEATAGGGFAALLTDTTALVAAIVAAGGGGNIVFFANPVDFAKISLIASSPAGFPYDVIPTRGLAQGTFVAIEAGAFISGYGPEPRLTYSDEALLHMDDTDPAAIGTAGTPNTVAAPVRSLWQTASIGVRLLLDVAWTLRAPQIAVITNATW